MGQRKLPVIALATSIAILTALGLAHASGAGPTIPGADPSVVVP
jgi:hypothetical protein